MMSFLVTVDDDGVAQVGEMSPQVRPYDIEWACKKVAAQYEMARTVRVLLAQMTPVDDTAQRLRAAARRHGFKTSNGE